jgi:hypothetical protein
MKLKIKIMRGVDILFEGELVASEAMRSQAYGKEKTLEAAFNIEQCINAQSAYRCHIEENKLST